MKVQMKADPYTKGINDLELCDIEGAIESVLFASGEPVSIERLAAVFAIDKALVINTAERMADKYSYDRRGIRLIRLEDSLQLVSSPEYADYVRLALETRKPPQLTPSALEVLSVVAYFQPVTKAYIEQVRGVDSSYTVGLLQDRGLIEACGRLAVPGRPVLYRTTQNFLRTFGISSIEELPELPELEDDDGQMKIQNDISVLQAKINAELESRENEENAEQRPDNTENNE